MNKYPQEVFVIFLRKEHGRKISDEQTKWVFMRTYQAFGNKMVNSDEIYSWAALNTVTFSDMIKMKKQIYFIVKDDIKIMGFGRQDQWGKQGYLPLDDYFTGEWYDSQTVEKTLMKNLEHSTSNVSEFKFKGTAMTVTAGSSGGDICCSIMGCKSLRPDNNNSMFFKNKMVHYFKKKHHTQASNWNIIDFDFPEWQPDINLFLIGLNYNNYDLSIKNCIVQSKDRNTEIVDLDSKISSHIVKNNSLWLIDFKTELGLPFKEGQIAFQFSFTPNSNHVNQKDATIEGICGFMFDDKTAFILNFHNHKEQGKVWEQQITDAEMGQTGFIVNGQVIGIELAKTFKGDMVLEYTKEPSGMIKFNTKKIVHKF